MTRIVSQWTRWVATPAGRRMCCVLLSVLLLAPCYWQPRLNAADLASHMDYGWFAQWLESGRWQSVQAVRTTNVLFDLVRSGFVVLFGNEIGERLCISAVVLIFVWGAFAFVSAISKERPWHMLASIAVLAYGWVFHMGFFNFYLSLGLCFWALALLCEAAPVRCALAAPLLILAYTAHALPVAWTLCLAFYLWAAPRVTVRARSYVSAVILCLIVLGLFAAGTRVYGSSGAAPAAAASLMLPAAVLTGKYNLVLIATLLSWGALFIDLLHQAGPRKVVSGAAFQICVLSTAAVALLPATVLLPGFQHAAVYVAERMALGVGVCLCALLGAARPRPAIRWMLVGAALVFFVFVYRDQRRVSSQQDRMQDIVAGTLEDGN